MAFSPYEPTGLYAKPNEQITINVEGNQDIQVYIGTYSYDASWREDSKIKSFTLKTWCKHNPISKWGADLFL